MSVLGDRVRDYAYSHLFQQVGSGQCADLATHALRAAGARARPIRDAQGNYVWGTSIPVPFAEPGDILQFRSYRVTIRNSDGTGQTEERGHPLHTAIVMRNEGNGALYVAEQNMVYTGARAANRTVMTAPVYIVESQSDGRTVAITGSVRAYRPQPL